MKRTLKNPLLPLLLTACVCLIFGAYMSQQPVLQEGKYGYKPMVYINDRIYGDIGIVVKSPPEGFELAETVKEKNIGVSAVYCYIDGTCYASSEKLCDQFKAFFEDDLK